MRLTGKAAIVTGASRGLGAALAARLAQHGARVVLVARGQTELRKTALRIREQGGEAYAISADIANEDDIYPLVGAAAALLGPIDLLVHNASALGPTPLALLLDTEGEDFSQVLETNVMGPFRLTRAVAGSMALRKEGVILHISSDASVNTYEGWGAYSVSKAALDHLSRLWAGELASHGVRVLSIDPGEMNTLMHEQAQPGADPGLLADPAQVAEKIVWLLENNRLDNGSRTVLCNVSRSVPAEEAS